MLNVTFVQINETEVPRLRAWLDTLSSRTAELAESYRLQHTRQELFYLIEGREHPTLVIVSESADLQAGAKEFLSSELSIDVEFKTLIQDISIADPAVELVYDSTLLLPVPASRSVIEEDAGQGG
ncbi:MAG: hypothetical protein JRG94_09605 [Deltaproteobacteria bacterium]|nr:hypothetical protein [Deltaproteobacteria bacterium]